MVTATCNTIFYPLTSGLTFCCRTSVLTRQLTVTRVLLPDILITHPKPPISSFTKTCLLPVFCTPPYFLSSILPYLPFSLFMCPFFLTSCILSYLTSYKLSSILYAFPSHVLPVCRTSFLLYSILPSFLPLSPPFISLFPACFLSSLP